MPDFVHLHVHTQYSLLDGAIRVKALMKRVAELGMSAVAMTDHGNMYGAVDFQSAAKKNDVKSIIGCELYLTKEAYDAEEKHDLKSYHLTVLAKNHAGYKNLMYLQSMAWLDGVHPRTGLPRVDFDLLSTYSDGLIVMSGDLGGEINQALLRGDRDEAAEIARRYKEVFGPEHYYLEIMQNGFPEQGRCNEALVALSDELGIPLVATNDCHYLTQHDAKAHAVLMAIQLGRTVDLEKLMTHGVDQLYVRSAEEMYEAFSAIPEACENTVKISEMCDLVIPTGEVYLPKYDVPYEFREQHDVAAPEKLDEAIGLYFQHVSREGLEMRIAELRAKGEDIDEQVYRDRLEEELGIILDMDFPGYFLIVWDFIAWSKEQGIPVGPGRGSGAGSLVAYSLTITDIDPIPYDLLFERFLNPERVSMPDFDIDFCMNRRGEVIQYVTEKYGAKNVGQIITYGQLKAKACVRDVGRALGLTFGETDRIAKLVPDVLGITLKQALEQEPRLREARREDPRIDALFEIALGLENLNRQAGIHAAGVVISETPLWDYVPICRGANGELVTQYAKNEVEEAGLVKFDFLGLKTLTVIETALKLINEQRATRDEDPFELATIPMDDQGVFRMISAGDTTGVFQLESSGFQELLKKLKPDCFEDIVAAVALYRPGPLGTGMVDDFIERKHGRKKVEYPHPWLAEVLKPTYGVMVYQEQVMMTARVMAGYSLGGADLLRRCVTGDTLVVDAVTGKRVRVDEVEEGMPIRTYDESTGRFVTVPVVERMDNGIKPVLRVVTRSGRRISLTEDHPLLTVQGWRHLCDVQVGDAIAVPSKLGAFGTKSPDDARIKVLAYLLGDGQTLLTCGSATARFYNSDKDILKDYVEALQTFEVRTRWYDHPTTTVTTITCAGLVPYKNPVNDLVREADLAHRAEHKRVPLEVFEYDEDALRLFLGTLWNTDGSVERTRISYSSSSEALIDDVAHLLLRFGVVTMRRSRKTTHLDNHELIISDQRDIMRFARLFEDIICPTKSQRLRHLVERTLRRTSNQSIYNVPAAVTFDVRDAKYASGLTWREAGERVGASVGHLSGDLNFKTPRRALSRHRLRQLGEAFESEKLVVLADADVLWDPIVSIDDAGEQHVYDLAVPPHANFVAADVVIHNSMGKKKKEVMDQQKGIFVEGAVGKGVAEQKASDIFDMMAYFAGYGLNKCVVGSTEIMDADTGAKTTVEDLFHDRRPFRIHAVDDHQKLQVRDVTDVVFNGIKPVFELVTDQGKRITATGNHPFLTLDGWKNLEDLKPGDRIAAPRKLECTGNEDTSEDEIWALWDVALTTGCVPERVFELSSASIDAFLSKFLGDAALTLPNESFARDAQWLLLRTGRTSVVDEVHGEWRATFTSQQGETDVFWETITEIEPRGMEPTFDLTVDVDHNFVADGLIVHNSHSAAYALITYQTGYLKKHFEVEFMAALMTNDRDNTDKVVRFINEAKSMGIEVLPPDVNESLLDFSVTDGKIRFGLAAVKGVGAGVIETILEAREDGPFESLYDFCKRVDLKRLNKKTIDALVKSGAFDAVGPAPGSRYIGDHCMARAQMCAAIPMAVDQGQKAQHDAEVGQASLFGMLSAPAKEEALKESYPDIEPWSDRDLLTYERTLIGFYVTGHPLDRFVDEIALYSVTPTSDVTYCKLNYRDDVTIAGVVSEYRERPLKSGNGRMAFATIEDKDGQCEVLVFSKAFAENEEALKCGQPILIKGQYTEDGDMEARVGKVRANEVTRLIDARMRFVRKVAVDVSAAELDHGKLDDLKELLLKHPGGCKTRLSISVEHDYGEGRAEFALPDHYMVAPTDELLTGIERLFRRKAVRLTS